MHSDRVTCDTHTTPTLVSGWAWGMDHSLLLPPFWLDPRLQELSCLRRACSPNRGGLGTGRVVRKATGIRRETF